MISSALIMSTKSRYRDTEVDCVLHEYATVKCVFSSAWKFDSEPPHRTLSQCVSTAQRDAEHRWTAETASSLGAVGVRRCTAERKSTKPYA